MTGQDAATPRVWVGCLGCYNAGHLVGAWFDAVDAPQDMGEWANKVAFTSEAHSAHALEGHEELWVFDHENFHGLLKGECSPAEAAEKAQVLIDANDPEALALFVAAGYEASDFDDAWCGWWESEAFYAEELAYEVSPQMHAPGGGPMWPLTCIDWERAWRELDMGGDNWSEYVPGKGYAIFRSV